MYADDQHYIDPHLLVNGSIMESEGKTRSLSLLPEVRYTGMESVPIVLGGEIGKTWFNGTDLEAGERSQGSFWVSSTAIVKTGLEIPFDVSFYPSLRYDGYSDVGTNFAPRLGVNIGLLKDPALRLRSSVGKNFRVPTFNDLYWIAGGNPALRPERSLSFDAGLLAQYDLWGKWTLDIDYFSIATKDRILWTPTSGTFWTPKNISKTFSRGVELEAKWESAKMFAAIASTWTVATKTSEDFPGDPTTGKQLVYVPRQSVSVTAGFHTGGLHIYVQNEWTSYRYTTENNDRFLPSFNVTSAAARYDLPITPLRTFVKAEVTNLFGTQYQVLALYPMPLQEVRLSVGGEL
jgi:iron complex outermembrane receptor protein